MLLQTALLLTENPPTGAPDEDTIIGSSFVNKYQRYEKFRPMIKLPGMNGYS